MYLLAEIKEGTQAAVLEAIAPFLEHKPKLLESVRMPTAPAVDLELAQKIADTIAPRPNQPMRREVLQKLMSGHDTFWSQQAEADANLRNGTAALSRALRPFSIWDSPLDLLFTRERRLIADGPFKGKYEGTRYKLTLLGTAVRDILRAAKAI